MSGEVAFDRSVARYRTSSGPLPADVDEEASLGVRVVRGIGRWLKGAVFTLGAAWIITWGLTTGIVSLMATNWRPMSYANTLSRTDIAQAAVKYGLPPDPSITEAQAEAAFLRLQPPEKSATAGAFVYRQPDRPRQGRVWDDWKLDPSLFSNARPGGYKVPGPAAIIPAVAKGFTPAERTLLRQLSTDPVWRDFDIVARAGAADLVRARFELPLSADASILAMPVTRFSASRDLAYAAVSRAAWHLAEGRRDSAEVILRSIISYGDVFRRNGVFVMDQLIGNVIVGVGRGALTQFYDAMQDPRGRVMAGEHARAQAGTAPSWLTSRVNAIRRLPLDEQRTQMIELATSPGVPLAIRTAMLTDLNRSACANPVTLVFGPTAAMRDGFTRARAAAKTPGERAVVDLVERELTTPLLTPGVLVSAEYRGGLEVADFVSSVYLNPRLAKCAVIASWLPGVQ